MPTELEREQALLLQLRDRGDPVSLHDADRIEKMYHVRQMDGLSQDVYKAAKGEDHPPPGWTRLSQHPELIAQYAERLNVTRPQLLDTLHPDNSGFRAEIYLPDAALQKAGFKPTLAFKGSTGEVLTSDGKRHDTSAEDFGANNFPQSIGMRTDYYDRAMALGYQLKQNGVDFESTGHSLAGGMSAAVAAVTGTQATTLNAAGLNPETTARFAQEHPNVYVPKDLTHLITNYQVQGELLSDGIQNNFHNLDALRRQELGATLKETCDVLQRVPEAKALFAQKLAAGLPPGTSAQVPETINAFVNKLATGNTDQMLRDLPLAAGEQHVLAAMTRDAQGRLMPRVQVTSLPETTRLAAPLLESLAVVSAGVHLGERGGEVVRAGGHLEAQGLHATGRGVDAATTTVGAATHALTRTEGAVMQAGEHAVGATLAHARTAQAEMSALLDQGLGNAQHLGAEFDAMLLHGAGHLLPEKGQHLVESLAARLEQAGRAQQQQGAAGAAAERHAGQVDAATIRGVTHTMETVTGRAADAYGAAQQSVISGSGHYARAGLDATAQGIDGTMRHAPAFFGSVGGLAGAGLALGAELNPANYPRLTEAAIALSHGKQAGSEALERHLLPATVTPSLDANIQTLERQAIQHLQTSAPVHAPTTQGPMQPAPVLDATRLQQRALHGESSQMDRAQEARRQQEIQGHTAAREAPLPHAPAAIPAGMHVPPRDPSVRTHTPASHSQEAQTPTPARPEPTPAAIDPHHAALAAQQAHQQAMMHAQRQAQHERQPHEERSAPTSRATSSLEPGRVAAAVAPLAAPSVAAALREDHAPAQAPSRTDPQAPTPNRAEAQRPEPVPVAASPAHSAGMGSPATHQVAHDPAPPARQAAETLAAPPHAAPTRAAPVLSPPLDPPSMRDFRHAEHPLNPRYQMFRDALGEQGFHAVGRPTLNSVPEIRGYSAEQKDRLAAGFTAQLGADTRYSTEIQHFGKDGDTLLAVEHPRELGAPPLMLAIPAAQTLARTPSEHAAGWRARELPEPQAVDTARPDPKTLSPDHPGHLDHPRHAMFEHAREALSGEYARWGMHKGAEPLDRETMQVVIAARGQRMDDVGAIRLGKGSPDSRIGEHPMLAVYSTPRGPEQPMAIPAIVQSQMLQQAPPVQQAAQQFQAVDQQATQQVQQMQQMQAQINAQAPQGPMLGGPGMGR